MSVTSTDAPRPPCSWLVKNKKFQGDARDFKRKVESIWFGLYRRETQSDSSGFEHVFVGEEKNVRRQLVPLSA